MDLTKLYYECHITIEPVFDDRLDKLTEIVKEFGFKPANLLMQKRKEDTPERSKYDTFCTGHGKIYVELANRMLDCIEELKKHEYKVWRYKIEDTICDSKHEDIFGAISRKDANDGNN